MFLKKLFFLLFGSLIICGVSSCSLGENHGAPSFIGGKIIAYHFDSTTGRFDKRLNHQNVIYQFSRHGDYSSYLEDGSQYEFGDYSFNKVSKERAHLVLTYSTNSEINTYAFVMDFETPSAGICFGAIPNDYKSRSESGSFNLMDKKEMEHLFEKTDQATP